MEYWKMDGAGNSFVCINNIKEKIEEKEFPEIARLLCSKSRGFDTDGMMVVDHAGSEEADFKMRFFNLDGSIGEMCGNGARCICRYAYENGIAGSEMKVETTAGIVQGWRLGQNMYKVRLNSPENVRLNEEIEIDGEILKSTYIELGNPGIPHAVVEVCGLNEKNRAEMFHMGSEIRSYKGYKKGANVNFFEITGPDEINILTFERGVENFTKACGTGSGSTAYILYLENRVSGKNVKMNCPGGQLTVDIDDNADIFLSGPADIIRTGEIEI